MSNPNSLRADRQSGYGEVEQKYVFVEQHKDRILECLHHIFIPDPQFFFGSVFSIYYDTPALDLYCEKRNSDYLKSKVRLRWYSALSERAADDEVKCYLELKKKYGIFRQKSRIKLSLPSKLLTDDPFTKKEILNLPSRIHELSYAAAGILVPIVLIQYKRHRFVDPLSGSRIALDTGIWSPRANSRYIIGFPPVRLGVGVLEVKGAPRHLLRSLNCVSSYLTREAFSKYARCCEHLLLPLSRRI